MFTCMNVYIQKEREEQGTRRRVYVCVGWSEGEGAEGHEERERRGSRRWRSPGGKEGAGPQKVE